MNTATVLYFILILDTGQVLVGDDFKYPGFETRWFETSEECAHFQHMRSFDHFLPPGVLVVDSVCMEPLRK